MGNALRFLSGEPNHEEPQSLRPNGVSTVSVKVSALAHDLLHFEVTSQVPSELSSHVVSSKKVQANWYKKLLRAWKEAKPQPKTLEEASRLITETLRKNQNIDVKGLLDYYGLPLSHALVQPADEIPSSIPEGVQFQLVTIPVDPRAVVDGDGMTVYVCTTDPREWDCVPREVQVAAIHRAEARAVRDYPRADGLHQKIIDSGYRVIYIDNEEILARKYRIRLRGIDAPENAMPYGKEAKEELTNLIQGKCLKVLVYAEDQYGRIVGDIYCDGVFVQEWMLKKGLVWHYSAYDKRKEFADWEKTARAKRIGL